MRRLAPSVLRLAIAIAAVLTPGTAVFASPAPALRCFTVDPADIEPAVLEAEVILIATVAAVRDDGTAVLAPEAYLKGPAQADDLPLKPASADPACAPARLAPGARVLAFLDQAEGGLAWPAAGQVYTIEGSSAVPQAHGAEALPEAQLVRQVRLLTEQYAVPAASGDEGAGIDWWATIVPVGGTILGLFAVGLVLMRIWHRIDPS